MSKEEIKKETLPMKRPAVEIMPDVQSLRLLATDLANSRLFPNVQSIPGAIAIIEYGRELGVPPVAALQSMSVIKGKLTMESKMMLALANKNAGVTWKILETTSKVCRILFKREGFSDHEAEFTMKEAEEAGLASKDNYKNYPKDMLMWRCSSRGIKAIAPDAILGLYSREEMEDLTYIESGKGEEKSVATVIEGIAPMVITTEEFINKPPEQNDVPFPQDTIVEEQADFPEPKEEAKPVVDKEKELLVENIKKSLELAGVNIKDFKTWLFDYQTKIGRKYLGEMFGNLSFTEGSKEDLFRLFSQLNFAVQAYQASKKKKGEKGGDKKS